MSALDLTRTHSRIDGDSKATFYQDGQYFSADHTPISHEEAAEPSVGGSFENRVAAEVAKATQLSEDDLNQVVTANDSDNVQNQQKAAPEAVKDAEEVFKNIPTKQLNTAVAEAGGTKFNGRFARKQAIEWLLNNTA